MSNLKEFDYGTTVRLTCNFEVDDVLTDPGTVDMQLTDPAGAITNYSYAATITKDAVGIYHVDKVCSVDGKWTHKWTATGAVSAIETRQFLVRRSGV